MRAVVQRVRDCSVRVDAQVLGAIQNGLLIYLGVGKKDTQDSVGLLVDKVANLRIFADDQGKMNRSALDVQGQIMVVSQFTLFGDVRGGRRPSFSEAADGTAARPLYESFVAGLAAKGLTVATGQFAAIMEVSYTNMGPVTILIDTEQL